MFQDLNEKLTRALVAQVPELLEDDKVHLTLGGGLLKEEEAPLVGPGMAMRKHPGLCTLVESCALRFMLNEHTSRFSEALEPFRCAGASRRGRSRQSRNAREPAPPMSPKSPV